MSSLCNIVREFPDPVLRNKIWLPDFNKNRQWDSYPTDPTLLRKSMLQGYGYLIHGKNDDDYFIPLKTRPDTIGFEAKIRIESESMTLLEYPLLQIQVSAVHRLEADSNGFIGMLGGHIRLKTESTEIWQPLRQITHS